MHDDETVVSDLVAQALEHRDETGTEIDLEALCGGRADLQTKVMSALKAATRLPMLQSAGVGGLPVMGDSLRGRYRIEERLGAGAMGVVYAASDEELGRRVAIKVLHHGVMEREQALARFEREAEALASVRQEAVVTIHDRGSTEDGSPFLVMELVEGIPLSGLLDVAAERIKRGESVERTSWLTDVFGFEALEEPSFLRQAASWARDLAQGLVAVHAAGIVHRDVKPSNIMIRWDGRPVILDFGAVLTEEESNLTRTGAAVGTPAYMAPETLQRERTESARPAADIYGLAATLYHLVTGVAPYAGTPSQILASLATRDPAPAAKLRDGLPRDLQAILDCGLARRTRQRYQDAAALGSDLDAFLNYRPVAARRVTSIERVGRSLRRSRAFQGGLAVALVAVGIVGSQAWMASVSKGQADAFAELERHVPANFAVVTYSNRVVADEAMTADLGELFDDLVATGGSPVVALNLRAAYRLDHGDPSGAAEDMRRVAEIRGSDFAKVLADKYESLPTTSKSAQDLDLKELPEPSAALDHYLAGFHVMRQLRYGEAGPHLSVPGLVDVRHARELALLLETIPIGRLKGDERFEAGGRLYEEAIRIEAEFGSRSSMTAHLAGYGLSAQERYAEALPICRDGLELAPAAHATSVNAARDAYRAKKHVESRQWIARSVQLLPWYPKAYETELLLRWQVADFDGARAYLDTIPFPDSGRDRRLGVTYRLMVDADEALSHLTAGETDEAVLVATEGLAFAKNSGQKLVGNLGLYASLCEAIVDGDQAEVFKHFCDRQAKDPLWPFGLRNMLRLMPPTLDSETRTSLGAALDAVADALRRRR